ncbi:hypothetical protein KDW_06850 [Dictyobacter vulcani]|uniref:Nucleotidyltransferase n=1 Tax=Dictyobacter vulcani TaxID=2607529 RepID=A0A5J4KFU0_9CHLR|nr:hypothetical protein [Dictyobacter vulcani]GER86523.1 hypothetical protein KDW_06850 [Dictyobacter vulcani]
MSSASPMNTPEIIQAISPLIDAFDRFNIPYFIGGSVASSIHGRRRATQDVDIVAAIQRHHVQALVKVLENDYYIDGTMIRGAIVNQSSFNVLHNDTGVKVDVFVLKSSEFARHELGRAREEVIEQGSRPFYVASPEDVILTKLNWWKMGGGISTRQWNDIVEVIKRTGDALDIVYLRQFAPHLGVTDILEQVLIDAGK